MKGDSDFIDVYGSELYDYDKIARRFGIAGFKRELFPSPSRLMRRGVVFSARGQRELAEAISKGKDYYALTGIMPTADRIHLGTKSVVETIAYFQEHGADTFILVADLEAAAARGVSLKEARKRALEFYIPAYVALGINPEKTHFYFQSDNKTVMNNAYRFSGKVTLNEFRAVYGNADPPRIMAAVTQIADILYPQERKRRLGVIPVGIDQDPHIRLTRDVINRMKRSRYVVPSSLYLKFMPSLDGSSKMSKSRPEGMIELPSSPDEACRKIKRALTGGRESVELQKKKGGEPDKCMVFELYKQHLIEDDRELEEIRRECREGRIMCGECKQRACSLMKAFLVGFDKKMGDAKKKIKKIDFLRE